MCKIVDDYATQKMKEARAQGIVEGELMKAVEVVKAMTAKKIALDVALECAKIDLKTYKKYSDNN